MLGVDLSGGTYAGHRLPFWLFAGAVGAVAGVLPCGPGYEAIHDRDDIYDIRYIKDTAMAGRPKRPVEITPVLLRIPPALLARVERCQALLQLQTGIRQTRIMAFEVLLDLGCAAIEAGYAQQTPVPPLSETSAILPISEISTLSPISEIPHAIAITPEAAPLAAHVLRIAEVAAQYDKLSLAELAQLLFDRGIYRATDRATGTDKPVNRGTLKKWLDQAREAGLL